MTQDQLARPRWGAWRRKPRHRSSKKLIKKLVVVATVIGLTVGGTAVLKTEPAFAATTGAGFSSGGDGLLGNYIGPDGLRAYCVDVQADWPSGATRMPNIVGSFGAAPGTRAVSGNEIKQLNAGLMQFGETGDNVQAAAVSAFVYAYTSANWPGHGGGIHYINAKAPAEAGLVIPKYNEIWNWVQANWNNGPSGGGGDMTFQVDPLNNYKGTLTVSLWPANASGSVTLTNGIFTDSGASSIAGVGNGSVLNIVGVAPDEGRDYKIAADGSFAATADGGVAADVSLYETPGQQRLVRSGNRGNGAINFTLNKVDPTSRSALFQPVLTTQVASRFVPKGETFTDVVTFSTVADAAGLNNPWRQRTNGTYLDIKALGVLYGPYKTKPVESAGLPPGNNPIAARASVSGNPAGGNSGSYNVTGDTASLKSGYYTWVWSIDAAEQSPVGQMSIPDNYNFTDRFGQDKESHVTQFQPTAVTAVGNLVYAPGTPITDAVSFRVDPAFGDWPDGVAVKFEGTAYAVPGAAPRYGTGLTIPADAVPILTTELTATAAGTQQMSAPVTTPSDSRFGFVTWVWKMVKAHQDPAVQELIRGDWQDEFFLPQETTKIMFQPQVATKVTSRVVAVGEAFIDEVTASVPAAGSGAWAHDTAVSFVGTLYGPFQHDPVPGAAPPVGAPVAGTETLTFTGPGTKRTSGTLIATSSGYYTWQWTMKKSAQPVMIRQQILADFSDQYGLAAESHVVPFQPEAVSRVDQDIVKAGDKVTDTIVTSTVAGTWPTGLPVTFFGTAYGWKGTTPPSVTSAVPAAAVKIGDVKIVANGAGTYKSPEVTVPNDVSYVTWVWRVDRFASMGGRQGELISANWQDQFGLADETSLVQFQPMVTTAVSTKLVKKGQPFVDTLHTNVSSGVWLDGVQVEMEGTLYGPLSSPPNESDTPPWFTPVMGTERVTAGGVGTYLSPGTIKADESGYYTWVWKIVKNDQTAATQKVIIGDFTDRYGQEPETHISPSTIVAVSAVTADKVALSEGIQDTLQVSIGDGGGWLTAEGSRVPVTFRGTAYHVPGEVAPTVSNKVPAGAVEIGSTTLIANKPGSYTSDLLTAPDAQGGWISWVWEVREADQPTKFKGFVEDWADQFGLANETQQILMPKLVTKAQVQAAPGQTMKDTAVITGTMPATPSSLYFSVYKAVDGELAPTCTPANRIFDGSGSPLTVTTTGEYDSPDVMVTGFGKFYWVETLVSSQGNIIHQGECGIENETTTAEAPKVKTKAQATTAVTETATDTAILDGEVPAGTSVVFDVFRQPQAGDSVVNGNGDTVILTPADITGLPVCTPDTLYGTTRAEPVAVAAGMNDKAEYLSPGVVFNDPGTYFWVEVLESDVWGPLHTGVCGAPGETTVVELPEVTTKAQKTTAVTETAFDTAIVSGLVPAGATLTFEVFLQEDALAAPVCAPSNLVDASVALEVKKGMNDKSEYLSPKVKLDRPGTYFWVETLRAKDGTVLHRGECGLENETTIVELPKVTSQAQKTAAVTETATDTAIVSGLVPAGATIHFEAYRQPQLGDKLIDDKGKLARAEDGTVLLLEAADVPTGPMCEPTNMVGSTEDEPVKATKGRNDATEYVSPEIGLHEAGTVYWIEVLLTKDGDELHRGECGLANETTIVELPTVTTEAIPSVELGQSAHDVAIVDGLVPAGAKVEFSAYKQSGSEPVCTPTNRVFDGSGKGVDVKAGINELAKYEGPHHTFAEVGTYYWVETLFVLQGDKRVVLHEGICGAPNETTNVRALPPLPSTGLSGALPLMTGGLLLLSGALIFFIAQQRRRRLEVGRNG